MELHLEPPLPLGGGGGGGGSDGDGGGEARWGGEVRAGPALCPLANVVLPPSEAREEARTAGALNARLGRPSSGSVDMALRCVATRGQHVGSAALEVPHPA